MEYNVYIDESGDEGIHRGSEWFILTAVIVPKEYDLNLSNKVVTIKEMLGLDRKSQLHWNKLNAEQRIKVIYSLIAENFKIIHVAINTFEIEKLKAKQIYPYFMSYLIERVSYYVTSRKASCNIYISTRQDNNKEKNNELKEELMNKRKYHKINVKCINDIKLQENGKKNLLQLADVCCSSFAQAIKYNTDKEWEYVIKLGTNIYSSNKGNIIGYGIKFYPPINWVERYKRLMYLK